MDYLYVDMQLVQSFPHRNIHNNKPHRTFGTYPDHT